MLNDIIVSIYMVYITCLMFFKIYELFSSSILVDREYFMAEWEEKRYVVNERIYWRRMTQIFRRGGYIVSFKYSWEDFVYFHSIIFKKNITLKFSNYIYLNGLCKMLFIQYLYCVQTIKKKKNTFLDWLRFITLWVSRIVLLVLLY